MKVSTLTLLSHRFTGNSTSCYGLNMQDVTSIPIHSFPVELCISNVIVTITVNGMLHCCSNQLLSLQRRTGCSCPSSCPALSLELPAALLPVFTPDWRRLYRIICWLPPWSLFSFSVSSLLSQASRKRLIVGAVLSQWCHRQAAGTVRHNL